jgi:hypothetical protein
MMFNFAWNDQNTKTLIFKQELLGIITLNTLNECEFKNKLFEYSKYITKVKQDDQELYFKYDIDNGILSLMQRNNNLDIDKYELINKIRENLWLDNSRYINDEQLEHIIKN